MSPRSANSLPVKEMIIGKLNCVARQSVRFVPGSSSRAVAAAHQQFTRKMSSSQALQSRDHKKEEKAWSTAKTSLHEVRTAYFDREHHFSEADLISNEPLAEFSKWFEKAQKCEQIEEPNACCVSTCSNDNMPSSRMVLLKEFGPDGFKFFTNYNSRKGRDLADNPKASILFYWAPLKAQIRIEGNIRRLSNRENDEYFNQRPRQSQIAASISHQSTPITSRERLDEVFKKFEQEHLDKNLERPIFWGGYLLKPERYEFWQGQTDRMHDRIQFRRLEPDEDAEPMVTKRGERGWYYERLAP